MLPLTVVSIGVLPFSPTTVTVSRTLPVSGVAVTVTFSPFAASVLSTDATDFIFSATVTLYFVVFSSTQTLGVFLPVFTI